MEYSVMPRSRRTTNSRRGAVAVEAAFCLPLLLTLMMGMWEVGKMVQLSQILANAAREGARYAATGNLNGTDITAAMVQQNVRDYLTSSGFPNTAVTGASIQLTNLSNNDWTDPCESQPMDKFQVTVTIPQGAAFDSLQLTTLRLANVTQQLSASATWVSLVDSQVTVSTQLPY
jgi:Flp pilus assembly protein TadG